MLRLAAARSTRRHVSAAVCCSRWNSTTPSSKSSSASTTGGQQTVQAGDDSLATLSRMARMQNDLPEDLRDVEELPAEHLAPNVARSEVEMFGLGHKRPFDYKALGLRHDPSQLPLRQTLDPLERPYSEEEYAMTLVHGRSVHEPLIHDRTHSIPVANIHFRSHHVELLNLFTHFALHAASSLGIPTSRVASLPTKRTLWTVLRSPFVHKKSQENFERKVHKRAIKAWDADAEVVQRWMAYLRTHALAGVGMKVTVWDRVPLGIGKAKVVSNTAFENPILHAPQRIKQLGQKIVEEEERSASL